MPALVLLASALGLNYARHKCGRSTICSTCRRYIGPRMFLALWAGLTAWLAPHYLRGFARAAVAVAEALDDTRPEIEESIA
jgi:hypothetical protein